MKPKVLAVAFVLAFAACSDNDLDQEPLVAVAGTWGGSVRNDSNSCPGAFTVGETTTIEVAIAQSGPKVDVKIQGAVGFFVGLALGSNTFSGSLTGDKIDASLIGDRKQIEGSCTYTYTGNLVGRVEGQRMLGTVTYKPNPSSGDCSAIESCTRVQSFDVEKGKVIGDAGVVDAPLGG